MEANLHCAVTVHSHTLLWVLPGKSIWSSPIGEVSSDADSSSGVCMCRRVVRGKWHKVIKLAVAEGVKRGALLS